MNGAQLARSWQWNVRFALFIFVSLLCSNVASDISIEQRPLGISGTESEKVPQLHTPREAWNVAVIGAGSAGASTAYYLRKYAAEREQAINITVFERRPYIGGRSTTVFAWDDPSSIPLELGASIFVQVNRNLREAAQALNLTVSSSERELAEVSETVNLGIWNGEEFVWIQNVGAESRFGKWWTVFKALFRWGTAPIRTVRLVDKVVAQFLQLYDTPHFPFRDLSKAAYDVGLTAVTAVSGSTYLAENSIGKLFVDEVVQSSTRVNYAQNISDIHGLESVVCMAIDGAVRVEGGNWQIFAGMLDHSDARVKLGVQVSSISRNIESGRFALTYSSADRPKSSSDEVLEERTEEFDTAVIAAPFSQTEISLTPEAEFTHPDYVKYVQLHVTLFASPHKLSPAFFGAEDDVPEIILTTLPSGPSGKLPSEPFPFFSISTLARKPNPYHKSSSASNPDHLQDRDDDKTSEYLYKIFSPERISDESLHTLIGHPFIPTDAESEGNSTEGQGADAAGAGDIPADRGNADSLLTKHVSWVHRKEWLSYPYLPPRITFENIQLNKNLLRRPTENITSDSRRSSAESEKDCTVEEGLTGLHARSLWYTGGIESFISTMETSSLMGHNVARLISDSFL